jgi:redox-sensitive bicupin YhaK (pirin superfamily)
MLLDLKQNIMTNNKMIVAEKTRNIGNFLVGRLLPFKEKRAVGPFVFIDHMGPTIMEKGQAFDVDQHPHIGLSTLTYLFEGEMHHKDSTGADMIITPGSVNFMTAGRGVTHTERTPKHLRNAAPYMIHGYQVWIALPREKENIAPNFVHLEHSLLPKWKEDHLEFTLIAGEGYGKVSPLPVYSPLFMLDIKANADSKLEIKGQLQGEIAIIIVHGSITVENEILETGQMMISQTENECFISLDKGTRIMIFGGKPFPEQRYLYWNFVSSDKEVLEKAKNDWKNKLFDTVPEDHTYIEMP